MHAKTFVVFIRPIGIAQHGTL